MSTSGQSDYRSAGQFIYYLGILLAVAAVIGAVLAIFSPSAVDPSTALAYRLGRICGNLFLAGFFFWGFRAISRSIREHRKTGRILGIIIGVIFFPGFPIGTIIGGGILFLLIKRWDVEPEAPAGGQPSPGGA